MYNIIPLSKVTEIIWTNTIKKKNFEWQINKQYY